MPIPKLAMLVAASPFDAALHDACGRALGISSFRTLTPVLVGHDTSRYLGPEFRGVDLQKSLREKPADTVPLFHSVGGSDPLTEAEADAAGVPSDGLPRVLADWIRRDGLWNIKIKLQGESLDRDVERTLAIDRIARETRPDVAWRYWFRARPGDDPLEVRPQVETGQVACRPHNSLAYPWHKNRSLSFCIWNAAELTSRTRHVEAVTPIGLPL